MSSEIAAIPASVTRSDVQRRVRFCSIDSAASACSTGPDRIRPFGTLKRSPSSSAVPPTMTFLSASFANVAASPRNTSTKETDGTEPARMPKSIRNGAALLVYCPASIAAIEGRYSPPSLSPNG